MISLKKKIAFLISFSAVLVFLSAESLPHGYKNITLGMSLEETKENLVICCKKEEKISDDKAEECVDDMIDNTVRFLDGDYDRIMSNIKHKINVSV